MRTELPCLAFQWVIEKCCWVWGIVWGTDLYQIKRLKKYLFNLLILLNLKWLRGQDSNLRPSGYEPDELPDCSTPRSEGICDENGLERETGFEPATLSLEG